MLSVVIPAFNGAPFIRQAIDSVFQQRYDDIEVIVVDDGSTDETAAIANSFGCRVRVLRQSNQGVGRARNRGIEAARGDFIAFLDQDDWWWPGKVDAQLSVLSADPEIGLVHTGVYFFDNIRSCQTDPVNTEIDPQLAVGSCLNQLLLGNVICNSSVIVRADILRQVGGCDTRIRGNTVQDYGLWIALASRCKFGFVADPFTVYRLHPNQGLWKFLSVMEEELRLLLRVKPLSDWRAWREGRSRIATLYDQLAVGYWELGNVREARTHFLRAALFAPTFRAAIRYAGSMLPVKCVNVLRQRAVQAVLF